MIAEVTGRVDDDERDRELDQRHAGLVRERGEPIDGLQLALVIDQRHVKARRVFGVRGRFVNCRRSRFPTVSRLRVGCR
jgi:hypothetical protein